MNDLNFPIFTYNKPQSIRANDNLNKHAELFRKTDFCNKYVSQEGFTINPIHSQWEYSIKFNGKSGWICITPTTKPNLIAVYVYRFENEILCQPTLYIRDLTSDRNGTRFLKMIKDLYRSYIQ